MLRVGLSDHGTFSLRFSAAGVVVVLSFVCCFCVFCVVGGGGQQRIEALDSLMNLVFLDLGNNAIRTIENVRPLKSLQHLVPGRQPNRRSERCGCRRAVLPHLFELDVSDNIISKLPWVVEAANTRRAEGRW